jgi:glutamate synthase (NADPH/NADH) small chain
VVFERGEQPGGLLRFGIPEFKMEKSILDRRLAQLDEEGIEFRCSVEVGGLGLRMGSRSSECVSVSLAELESEFDAIVLAIGSTIPRDLTIPGRDLAGIYPAMEYLKPANMVQGSLLSKHPIDAKDAHVVIIGGGDTGADCLGTAHRQGALSVTQLEIMPQPPETRSSANPWPTWPMIFRTSSAHEEGGERLYSVTTTEFVGSDGRVSALRGQRVEMVDAGDGRMNFEAVPGSAFELKADLVLLALGFSGPETTTVAAGLTLTQHGTIEADESWATSKPGVFVCGDATRGQSLIVWAIAEGRSAARSVDTFLMGESDLPSPVVPGQVAIR